MKLLAYVLGVTLVLSSLYVAQSPSVNLPPFFSAPVASADSVELMGYAWSSNIGWISVNCANTGTCGTSDYKVVLDTATNELSGYAWSEHVGWIQFGGLSGCPGTDSNCDARMVGNELRGWARATMGDGIAPDIEIPPSSTIGTSTFSSPTTGTAFVVPTDVTEITVKAWGAGGGGGGGGGASNVGVGGAGGGGGFSQGTISVTSGEVLAVHVGGGGVFGTEQSDSGSGGGGGGYSGVFRSSTPLVVAAAGGGGGGATWIAGRNGGAGGAGGTATGQSGFPGQGVSVPQSGGGGGGGTQVSGGAAGTTGDASGNPAQAGVSLAGGVGGSDGTPPRVGGAGGLNGGGSGGDDRTDGTGGGGGGGAGYYGGGGGGKAMDNNVAGGGGGGGSNYVSGSATVSTQGNGSTAANTSDPDYVSTTGQGGTGGSIASGLSGGDGLVVITYGSVTGTTTIPAPTNGWDGWISLNCANTGTCGTADYGVDVGASELSGYAWSGDVMGWISFNCSNDDSCATVNYRVYFNSPCTVGYQCSVDFTQSVATDAWCNVATTTCSAGQTCRTDLGNICGPGSPIGQLNLSAQRVRKGTTVDISWPTLAYYDNCQLNGTQTGGGADSWSWSSSSPLTNVTTRSIENEVTYTLECTPIADTTYQTLDTERITILPSIKEF